MDLSPTSVLPTSDGASYDDEVDIIKKLEKENVNLRLANYLLHKDRRPPSNSLNKQNDAIRQFYHFDDDDLHDPLIEDSSAASSPQPSPKYIMDLENRIQELERRLNDESVAVKKLRDDNIVLEAKFDALMRRSHDDNTTAKKLLEENGALEIKVNALERRNHDSTMAINELQEENNSLETKVDNLEASEASLIRESYLSAEDMESKNEIISMLREENQALEKEGLAEKDKYEMQLQIFKCENNELGQAIGKMEKKIDGHILRQVESEVEITKYKNENLALKSDVARLQNLQVENEKLSKMVEEEKNALGSEVDELSSQNRQLKSDMAHIEEVMEKMRVEHSAEWNVLLKEKGTMRMSIGQLEDEILGLKSENEKLRETEESMRRENSGLKRVPVSYVLSEGLASKYDALERDNKQLRMDNTVLLRQTEYLGKTVAELQSRLRAAASFKNTDLLKSLHELNAQIESEMKPVNAALNAYQKWCSDRDLLSDLSPSVTPKC